ncbi:MAG: N-acetylmuramoyl-L-alanine amidase, partial [Hyphococcus sp.]
MANPREFFLALPTGAAPAPFSAPEQVYPDIHWYNRHRASNRMVHNVNGVEAVVIHATAGGSSQSALSWWKAPHGARASAHWIVPGEEEPAHGRFAWAVVYEALAAWHVRNGATHPRLGGRARVNHWSLGIEIVNR